MTTRRTAVLVAALALLTSARPDAAALFFEGGFRCAQNPNGGGSISIGWPVISSAYGGVENVYFMAVVYKLVNGQWVPVMQRPQKAQYVYPKQTWFFGTANSTGLTPLTGLGGFTFSLNGVYQVEPNVAVTAGSYAVGDYAYWASTGETQSQWASYRHASGVMFNKFTGYYYCTFK